eukprot:3945506-Prorocentrum_lima.AAC.1
MLPHDSVTASVSPAGAVSGECGFQCGVKWKHGVADGGTQDIAGDRWKRFVRRTCWNARRARTRLGAKEGQGGYK